MNVSKFVFVLAGLTMVSTAAMAAPLTSKSPVAAANGGTAIIAVADKKKASAKKVKKSATKKVAKKKATKKASKKIASKSAKRPKYKTCGAMMYRDKKSKKCVSAMNKG